MLGFSETMYIPYQEWIRKRSVFNSTYNMGGSRGGGVSGVATPPNGQSHSTKYSTSDVLRHADTLIYIAKCLVVVVVRF